ncbi:HEAT repeat-containing protein 3 [Pararge aegeria]|uniref:HEAT repeat-containing protein 3 n=1 Tax=Pararge aegeria TaxID=116150 RepID=UPI0019CFD146|nr:HEAT repeat-containing protein 3 [Pararge aegeria]
MGKVRKRKAKPSQTVNNATVHSSDEEELPVDNKENMIQTIIDQLQGANVEEKYCGLQTFAMLLENQESLREMINRGLVKMVAPLLIDPTSSVRNAAAGSLRNLSTDSHKMCDDLMEHDVMTSLVFYYHQFTETWTPDPSCKNKDDFDTFVQCTNLLLNLCESSELAVKYLGDSKILDIFPRYLDLSTFGVDIVTAILQCLLVVVENNPVAIEKIKSSSERQLKELLLLEDNGPSSLLIKTLAGGVIINMSGGNISTLPIDVMNQIIGILAKTLSLDHRLACNQLSSNVPLCDPAGKVNPPKATDDQVLENQIRSVLQVLDAQQSAIEIIANVCSCDDSDDSIEGPESSDSDEPLDENGSNNGEGILLAEDRLPPELLEGLISLEIFDKVWARTLLPPANVLSILNEYEGSKLIYKKLHNLQTIALLCINNMLLNLPIENLGGVNGVYKIWVETGKLVFKQNSDNFNVLESATAVMRAALDKIKLKDNEKPTESNLFSDLAISDIEIMLTGIRECQFPEIRTNLIRMIGILALLLVNNLNDTASIVICTITEFILEQAHKENKVWVLAEAIDTLVDLYSEDETDLLAAKVKLVEKLSVLAPILKNMARNSKKLPKEYKVLVTTANSNLPRFIKYKKARLSSF